MDSKQLLAFLFLFVFFLLFSDGRLDLQLLNPQRQMRELLDEEWHGEIHEAKSPAELEHNIWWNEFVAGVETRTEEFLFLILDEESEEVLDQLGIFGLESRVNAVSIHLIFHRKIKRLLIAFVPTVEEGGNSPELYEFMLFAFVGEGELVEVVMVLD